MSSPCCPATGRAPARSACGSCEARTGPGRRCTAPANDISSHPLPLAVRNVRSEIAGREKRQHLDLVRGDAEFAIAIQDVFLADLGVCKKQRRATGSVPIAILSSLPFPICRDLGELRLEAMLEIVDGHDVRDGRLEGQRGRRPGRSSDRRRSPEAIGSSRAGTAPRRDPSCGRLRQSRT